MVAISARFDGKVFIPDEAVDMPQNQRVLLHVEPELSPATTTVSTPNPSGTPGAELLRFAGTLPKEDAEEIMRAIEDDCGQIDEDGW